MWMRFINWLMGVPDTNSVTFIQATRERRKQEPARTSGVNSASDVSMLGMPIFTDTGSSDCSDSGGDCGGGDGGCGGD